MISARANLVATLKTKIYPLPILYVPTLSHITLGGLYSRQCAGYLWWGPSL